MFNQFNYSISENKNSRTSTEYRYSDKSLEEMKKENPGKKVAEITPGFPVKSTIFLLFSLSFIVYSRILKRKEKNIIKLWDLLEQNQKLDLKTLNQKFGYNKEFVLEALHYINKQPNTSFTYKADTDLIYDESQTVAWHLAINCPSCGGVVNEKVFISMSAESFSCPYCSSLIIDPKFLEHKKEKQKEKDAEQNNPSAFVNSLLEKNMPNGASNTSIHNDPDKANVSWRPLNSGGSSFVTRKIKVIHRDRVEFKVTFSALVFNLIFLSIGVFLIYKMKTFSMGVGGALFSAVGLVMMWFSMKPIVFDKTKGYFWKGRKSPDDVINMKDLQESAALEDILALQIVQEYCSSSKSKSFYSYELNLVLNDYSRINVFDHGGYKKALIDAEKLAEFLDVPLWDDNLQNS